jgi:N utilization substance protein A
VAREAVGGGGAREALAGEVGPAALAAGDEAQHQRRGVQPAPGPPVSGVRRAATAVGLERERQFNDFKDRVGEIINGTVKRAEYGNVVVDLGRAEAIMRRSESIPREAFQLRDRIRAYIYDVRQEVRGPQIFLSRTRPEFMAKLFTQEVPEIYDSIVEIKSVARDPGSRAKIAVISNDSSVDPVGACVGLRGSRVQAVVNELHGEKIDIIQWSPDAATFIVNALAPAEVTKVVLDEESERIEVVVPDEQLSLAIGRRGQNVRLASQLTGWDIDILTEKEESERRQAEFVERSNAFMEALNVDEVIAQLLVSEGFTSVEEVAYVDPSEVASIEGFDEATAAEIQGRAREFLQQQEAEQLERCRQLGVSEELRAIEGLTLPMMIALGGEGVRTVEDLAYCATDDLAGWYEKVEGERKHFTGILEPFKVNRDAAETIIMLARLKAGIISQADFDARLNPPAEDGDDAAALAMGDDDEAPQPSLAEEDMPVIDDRAEHQE